MDTADEALNFQRMAMGIHRELASGATADAATRLHVASDLVKVGDLLLSTGDPAQALASHLEARKIVEDLQVRSRPSPQFDRILARARLGAANALYRTGKRAEAAAESGASRSIWRALVDADGSALDDWQALGECSMLQSACLVHDDRLDEALAGVRETIAIWLELSRAFPRDSRFRDGLAICRDTLGLIHTTQGRPDAAADDYALALAIAKDGAAAYPGVAWYRNSVAHFTNNMGLSLSEGGHPTEGEAACEEALASFRERLEADPSSEEAAHELALAHLFLGEARRLQGRADEARPELDEGRRRLEELIGRRPETDRNDWNLPWLLWRLGLTRAAAGDVAGAAADIRRSLTHHGDEDPIQPHSAYRDFDRGCAFAALATLSGRSGSGIPAVEGQAAADRAVAMLRRSIASGFRAPTIAIEPALDILRPRPDFRLLLLDLSMPHDPFARPG
jgi:tetratricopeptide (TPR) repeat protein